MRTIGPRRLMDAATEKRRRPRLGSGAVMTSGRGFARHWLPEKIPPQAWVRNSFSPGISGFGCA